MKKLQDNKDNLDHLKQNASNQRITLA